MNKFDANLSKHRGSLEAPRFHLRYARTRDIQTLNALCRQSKRHWGYDDDFLEKAETELMLPDDLVRENQVLVADTEEGAIGVAAIERINERTCDLSHLFVRPKVIGFGVGRALFAGMAALATGMGAETMTIVSDPNAVAFYETMGAHIVGEQKSTSATGRILPLLHYDLKA